ncbi:MAG TPA: bifunctional diaminohydroxyphosphoribosylaminopyrimidine deaminase/5-amino-6-(5-phosphoribosylamino)uracil reductase RibD [Bacteroidia bacterium]|nr:bifunctional diaminohydroxyphosphoribosylaminopyrimidine deaminase/5-amino-6-(5-phosphoribosylamino)uracil reductase RibD [Bacteroidia bacterium]
MSVHEKYIKKCLKLAAKGFGSVAPNPMVGCVIVHKGKIIGEGYHEKYGGPHAEINAINPVKKKELLKGSTLYVSLEPCAHHGKTPPCADAILKYGIKKVVIGSVDPNPLVKGKGIAKLIHGGCDVITGVLEKECMDLNKRFFTFHSEKRPYIILKWAMTKDGFMDINRQMGEKPLKITGAQANKLSHTWRSEEQAIMVGTNTAVMDNPKLTTRNVKGRSPVRIVIDRNLSIPANSNIFSNFASVVVLNAKKNAKQGNIEFVKMKFKGNVLGSAMTELYKRNIQSVIVEGGAKLLNSFIEQGLWDEARLFSSGTKIGAGIKAPAFSYKATSKIKAGNDTLTQYVRK